MNELFHQRVRQFLLKRHSTKFQSRHPNGISLLFAPLTPLRELIGEIQQTPRQSHAPALAKITTFYLLVQTRFTAKGENNSAHLNWLLCVMKKIPSKSLFF